MKKAKERQEEKERKKQERERKAIERQKKKEEKERISKERKAKKQKGKCTLPSPLDTAVGLGFLFDELDITDDGKCNNCELAFNEEDEERFWVCCDSCDNWYCFACHKFTTKESVPNEFYCMKCT
uniref:Zinc finger PHD-type domain-containing protein n=1 Tax=Amphimedon queenslandica TaxID=400682 RepID=A0A1X7TCJ0_AMPQE